MKHNILIYTTQNCSYCHLLKQFLEENKIKFKEVDVGKDKKAAKEMIEKSGQIGVPVTEINGKIITGFNRQAIAKELGIE